MKSLFLFLAALGLFAVAAHGMNFDLDTLIEKSCQELENCENEGKTAGYRIQPTGVVVHAMCQLQLTRYDKITCYQGAFSYLTSLDLGAVNPAGKSEFPARQIKSYYHFVNRNCLNIPMTSSVEDWAERTLECWEYHSLNIEIELRLILLELERG